MSGSGMNGSGMSNSSVNDSSVNVSTMSDSSVNDSSVNVSTMNVSSVTNPIMTNSYLTEEDKAFFDLFNIEAYKGYTWFEPCWFVTTGNDRLVEESMQNLYYRYFSERGRECVKICDKCKRSLNMSEWRHGCKDYLDTHFDVWGWVRRFKPYHPDIEESGFITVYDRDACVRVALDLMFERCRVPVLCHECKRVKP